MRLRFPKAARLSQAREFHRVRDDGRSWPGRFFVLGVWRNDGSGGDAHANAPSRVGFVTSRRVGAAHERNRVRRRLREIVRASRPKVREGCWIVLVARRAAVAASFEVLREEWLRLARRAGILPPPAVRDRTAAE